MLIEQIIEFQLRAWAHWSFMYSYKWLILWQNKNLIYCKNIAGGNIPYFPLHGPNHLQLKFYPTMQDFKRVLDFNCK